PPHPDRRPGQRCRRARPGDRIPRLRPAATPLRPTGPRAGAVHHAVLQRQLDHRDPADHRPARRLLGPFLDHDRDHRLVAAVDRSLDLCPSGEPGLHLVLQLGRAAGVQRPAHGNRRPAGDRILPAGLHDRRHRQLHADADQSQNPIRLVLNPTSYPLTVHRTVGNLAYIGFAFGGLCAIRYLRAKTAEDKSFYDWAGSFGSLWGVSMTLLQPVVGYSYAKEIQLHAYSSWYKMMFGTLSPVFLWQITLLGLMLITATLYFGRRLRTDGAPGAGLLRALSVAMVLTTLLAAQPYHLAFTYADVSAAGLDRPFWEGGLINPLGSMIPWKVLALMFYTLIAIGAVVWYLRGLPGVIWGTARRGEERLLLLMAVL